MVSLLNYVYFPSLLLNYIISCLCNILIKYLMSHSTRLWWSGRGQLSLQTLCIPLMVLIWWWLLLLAKGKASTLQVSSFGRPFASHLLEVKYLLVFFSKSVQEFMILIGPMLVMLIQWTKYFGRSLWNSMIHLFWKMYASLIPAVSRNWSIIFLR